MIDKLSLAYLTGSKRAIKNHLFSDELIDQERRTVGQMFFQPYESKKEFIYCARHTILPVGYIALTAALSPNVMIPTLIAFPFAILGLSAMYALLGKVEQSRGDEDSAAICYNQAITLCQLLLDLVVLPLSALIMLTRGVSTGLHATGIFNAHEEQPLPSGLGLN